MTLAQKQLLSVCVLDLGYTKEPEYGAVPIRHIVAWNDAVHGVAPDEVSRRVSTLVRSHQSEVEWRKAHPPKRGRTVDLPLACKWVYESTLPE